MFYAFFFKLGVGRVEIIFGVGILLSQILLGLGCMKQKKVLGLSQGWINKEHVQNVLFGDSL